MKKALSNAVKLICVFLLTFAMCSVAFADAPGRGVLLAAPCAASFSEKQTLDQKEFSVPGEFSQEVYELAGFSARDASRLERVRSAEDDLTTFATILYLADNQEMGLTTSIVNLNSTDAQIEINKIKDHYNGIDPLEAPKESFERGRVELYLQCMGKNQTERDALTRSYMIKSSGFDSEEEFDAYQASQEMTAEEKAAWRAWDIEQQKMKMRADGLDPDSIEIGYP